MTRSTLSFDSAVATGRGDDGSTGLLFGGDRVRKDDLRTEAYGTVDEAVAALGLARAELGMKAQYGVLPPHVGGLGELLLRFQRELFVVGAELATNPDARAKQQDGVTRVSREMVDGLDEVLRATEGAIELPKEFVVPGETPAVRRARAGPDRHPARRAADRHAGRGRRGHRRRQRPSLPEPARRPALDPGPRGRTGRGEVVDRGPALAGPRPHAGSLTREERTMSGYPQSGGMPPQSVPQTPSQLGVRPAPALVQQLLVGAFGWMFAGLLLTAGVAYLVGGNEKLLATVGQYWFLIAIGQFALAIAIQGAINRISPTASLGLFFVYAASMGFTIALIVSFYTTASVASAFFSAAAMFGAAAVYGAVTKRELARVGGILFMGLIGIIVASVVNIFLASGTIGWVISVIGVVLFTALTAYDVQRITRGDYAAFAGSMERAAIIAALHLYLDFINLFLFLLRIFGGRN